MYSSLASNDPKLVSVLNSIIAAPPTVHSDDQRVQLVNDILNDIRTNSDRLPKQHVPLALTAVKSLGRVPIGSETIIEPKNFDLIKQLIVSGTRDETTQALKCVANALLLLEPARDQWAAMLGGEACIRVLETSQSAEDIFSAARVLFLLTVKQSPYLKQYVEKDGLVTVICSSFDPALNACLAHVALGKEALTDLLKLAFNLLLIYPRITDAEKGNDVLKPMGELWDDRLAGFVAPLLRLLHALAPRSSQPLQQPLTLVINALLNVPIPEYASAFLTPPSTAPTPDKEKSKVAERVGRSLLEPLNKAMARLHLRTGSPSSGRSSPSRSSESSDAPDALQRVFDLFDASTARYFAGDPDDPSVRSMAARDGVVIDDVLPSLVVLLIRLAMGSEQARVRLRATLLPPDLDRTRPLEERQDLLGRCLRILKSVYLQKLRDLVAEMLFAICDCDATTLAGEVGYGNVAGFLFNKGLGATPPAAPIRTMSSAHIEEVDEDDAQINPITGMRMGPNAPDPLEGMTEEEREREAERLFVLFERLERTGAIQTNPIREAAQQGRWQYP